MPVKRESEMHNQALTHSTNHISMLRSEMVNITNNYRTLSSNERSKVEGRPVYSPLSSKSMGMVCSKPIVTVEKAGGRPGGVGVGCCQSPYTSLVFPPDKRGLVVCLLEKDRGVYTSCVLFGRGDRNDRGHGVNYGKY